MCSCGFEAWNHSTEADARASHQAHLLSVEDDDQATAIAADLRTVTAALIVLSGHLPLFSDDPKKVKRAGEHLTLRDLAFEALDRLADTLEVDHPVRVHSG